MEGDLLLRINGSVPLDILDYMEASQEGRVVLRLRRGGRELTRRVRKGSGEPLGLVFDTAVFDGVRKCRNRCVFCFVDRMPPGLRPTLYEKDDDYRLSFYYGNFVTLNNLGGEDVARITRMRISPLYVSLHATDGALRSRLMGGGAAAGLEVLARLLRAGIEVHLQVVVCPGMNDGEALRNTFRDVLETYPASSLGVVPVGLTSTARQPEAELEPCDRDSARAVLETVEDFQNLALERLGRRLFFAADEFYILAGRDFPDAAHYEEYPQLENGVGMARKFMDEARDAARREAPASHPGRGVITGVAGRAVVEAVLEQAGMGGVEVLVVENALFGASVTVTSLLSGGDIAEALRRRRPSARELIFPVTALRDGRFIDDLTPRDVECETGYGLVPVAVEGGAFLCALRGNTGG